MDIPETPDQAVQGTAQDAMITKM